VTPKARPNGAQHGTRSYYVYHRCRCPECRAANTAYTGNWAAKKRDARPLVSADLTRLRVRHLEAAGIRPVDLARMLGYAGRFAPFLLNRTITQRNEERVRVVYEYFITRPAAESPEGIG